MAEKRKNTESRYFRIKLSSPSHLADKSPKPRTKQARTTMNCESNFSPKNTSQIVPCTGKSFIGNTKIQLRHSDKKFLKNNSTACKPESTHNFDMKKHSMPITKLKTKESDTSLFKFKYPHSVQTHSSVSLNQMSFKILDKNDLKLQVSQVSYYLDQLKARYSATSSIKVLSVYATLLRDVYTNNEKLNYLFFGSKHYIHNRTKANIKQLLTCGLFLSFEDTVDYDIRINKKVSLKEENFDFQFYKSLKKSKHLLKDKLQKLQTNRIVGFKNKSERLLNGLNSVINENVAKNSPVNSRGLLKTDIQTFQPKGCDNFKDVGKLIESGHYFGKPNFTPGARFGQAWHYNKQLRVFLNDLSTTLTRQYSSLGSRTPKH